MYAWRSSTFLSMPDVLNTAMSVRFCFGDGDDIVFCVFWGKSFWKKDIREKEVEGVRW